MKKKIFLIILAVVVITTGLTITGISYFNNGDNSSNPLQIKKFSEFNIDNYKLKDSYDTKESLMSDYESKAREIKEIVRYYNEEDAKKVYETFDSTVGADFRERYQKYPQPVLTSEEQIQKDKADYINMLNSRIEEEKNNVKLYTSFIINPEKADGDYGIEEGTEIYNNSLKWSNYKISEYQKIIDDYSADKYTVAEAKEKVTELATYTANKQVEEIGRIQNKYPIIASSR